MSQIGENKVSKTELNIALIVIDNIIKSLSSYDGKVFGEYVREVVVPRMKNPTCDVRFNSVDIWFKNETNKNNFINYYPQFKEETNFSGNIDITVLKQLYCFIYRGIPIKFNIVVDIWFPIYDFDVNSLTYSYVNDTAIVESNIPTFENKLDQIIKAIDRKKANMNVKYFTNMVDHCLTYPERAKMINELYESRGWTILCEGVKITFPFTGTFDDAKAKEKSVNKALSERSNEIPRKIDLKQEIPNITQWSPEKAGKAKANNTFISVGSVRFSTRFLSGATRSWTSDNLDEQNRIFNLAYRITGTQQNISTTLKEHGYSDSQIVQAIENSITKDNYESTKKIEYLEELERHKKSSKDILEKKDDNLDKQKINLKHRITGTQSDKDSDERRNKLISDFTLSDEIFKTAIINRNKAFFKCISDFEITDKLYI